LGHSRQNPSTRLVILPAVTYRIAVAVSGRGSNLLALGDALARDRTIAIVRVLSDRAAPALDLAAARGWPRVRLSDPSDGEAWLTLLDADRVDLLVLAGYLRLVPAPVVATYRGRIINIHPALLPRHGGPGMYGARVHRAVLEAGERQSGATVHLVDEVYDRGAILGQATVPVEPGDTADQLAARVLAVEHRLLPAAVRAAARAGKPVPFVLA
jgi:formyltetrahydrofolate-dependent phosphoribosylglycinamide formyltransferase